MSREKQIEEIKRVLIRTCKRVRTPQEDYMQDRYAESIYNADYRKQSDFAMEIIGIINKRIEINQYHLQGNNTDLFHGIYQGRYEAYRDIAEIIEQRYGAKMKGGAE